MEKKTVVDQVEVKRDGTLQVRLRKILVEDDGSITDLGYHRTAAAPGSDLAAQLETVDQHLQDMKAGGLPPEEKAFVEEVKDAMWTPERVEAKVAEIAEIAAKSPGAAPPVEK